VVSTTMCGARCFELPLALVQKSGMPPALQIEKQLLRKFPTV
jgi:hypothetical protein